MAPKKSGQSLETAERQTAAVEERRRTHVEYLAANDKVRDLLSDFLATLLLHKPEDAFVFAKTFFAPYQQSMSTSPPNDQSLC